jgi:uncharacterized caspase-like protein
MGDGLRHHISGEGKLVALRRVRNSWRAPVAFLRALRPGDAARRLGAVVLILLGTGLPVRAEPAASHRQDTLADNADSIAVVIGNQNYRQTVAVDFAQNDAEAIKSFLVQSLGYREQNVLVLKDATLSELNQALGSERNPQDGRLWRQAVPGRSNVFVYFSGHGVPDLSTKEPFLLPQDGNPAQGETGYRLETLYANLGLLKRKVGPDRQVIVVIDACFTGETGRRGESLLAVSAPGFAPAKPKDPAGLLKLVATSGATPANWDREARLGLFTTRLLMGAAGLARPSGSPPDAPLRWGALRSYVREAVREAARRDSGREQMPEIDEAELVLPVRAPVPAVRPLVEAAEDDARWREASRDGGREALERYVARCEPRCRHRDAAMNQLLGGHRQQQKAADEANWQRLSRLGRYDEYLAGCGAVCAYRSLAEGYLGAAPQLPSARPMPRDSVAARAPQPQGGTAYLVGLDPAGDNWLALRSEPAGRGYRILKMGPDTRLVVIGRQGAWSQVRLESGEVGWASSRYIACCR